VSFAAPYLLIGLVAVPLAALGYRALDRRRRQRSLAWSRQAMLPNIASSPSRRARLVPAALFLLGLSLLLVGVARPEQMVATVHGGAPTVVLAFDVSNSMAATDVRPSRLRAARAIAIQFLHELPADYPVAVVAFGDKASLLAAPTVNRDQVIASLPTNVTPRAGTAIGDGISYSLGVIAGAAGQRQPGSIADPGAVLVLSDGGQNAGGTTPQQAAVTALVDYVPVDSIAVGTRRGVVTQTLPGGGPKTLTQVSVPVQPSTLRMVSHASGGSFFEADAATRFPAELASVYRNLRPHLTPGRKARDLSALAAGLALVLVLAGVVVSGLWFGRIA
jgi:Ca-activated chloride channel homolog